MGVRSKVTLSGRYMPTVHRIVHGDGDLDDGGGTRLHE